MVSGIIIGLVVPWAPQVLFLSVLALLMVAGRTWWLAERTTRRALLIRWGTTVLVALVVASWFVVPLAKAYLTGQVDVVADLFLGSPLVLAPFTIISPRPAIIAALQIAGVLGLAGLWRRTWWAPPLGLYVGGVLIGRALMLVRFANSGHAFMLYYVAPSLGYALDVAGILTLVEVWAWARGYLAARDVPVRLVAVTLCALLIGASGYAAWAAWAPAPRGVDDNATNPVTAYNLSMSAHADLLPNGDLVALPGPGHRTRLPERRCRGVRAPKPGRRTSPRM